MSKFEVKGHSKRLFGCLQILLKNERKQVDQRYIIKYYSPVVAEGKTFVLVFCVL